MHNKVSTFPLGKEPFAFLQIKSICTCTIPTKKSLLSYTYVYFISNLVYKYIHYMPFVVILCLSLLVVINKYVNVIFSSLGIEFPVADLLIMKKNFKSEILHDSMMFSSIVLNIYLSVLIKM